MSDETYQLSEYEKFRIERIKNNDVRLKQLGLDKSFASHCPKPVTTKRPKTKKWVVKSGQERRSPRLKQISEAGNVDETVDKDHVIFSYDSDDFVEDESKSAPRSRSLKWIDFQISKEELEALEKNIDGNYLEKFREYLVYKNKISPQNEKSVMRQITKLANGEGVRYESEKYGWPEGCYFMKGTKVEPTTDVVALLIAAQKCEDKWGRDRGNGWLLLHPLKKLLMFQQFALLNPAFLKSRCKLAQYCEVAKSMEVQVGEDSGNRKSEGPRVSKSHVVDSKHKRKSSSKSQRSGRMRSKRI